MSSVSPSSSKLSDLRVLWHLVFKPVRGNTHAERLDSFYSGQADNYDSFRSRMLHGRRELVEAAEMPVGGIWVDMGAGTGENVLFAGERATALREIHLVDLSEAMLERARTRFTTSGLDSVQTHLVDACSFTMPPNSVDLVTFSYSLTMIPDWFDAIASAEAMLKPGGTIAVVDFFISRKFASASSHQHNWLTRAFWTNWFASDNVFLSSDHSSLLRNHFKTEKMEERHGKVPYLPLVRAPYYTFIGRKRG